MLSPTAREYPFPSGQPRGKEAGNVAVFGSYTLSMCVCILVINGGRSNICSSFFFHRHMTHSQSFLALIRHKFWPPSFFGSLAQCGYAMASVISTRAKKQIIVFINSCHGHAPTHDSKEGDMSNFCLDQPVEPHGQKRNSYTRQVSPGDKYSFYTCGRY